MVAVWWPDSCGRPKNFGLFYIMEIMYTRSAEAAVERTTREVRKWEAWKVVCEALQAEERALQAELEAVRALERITETAADADPCYPRPFSMAALVMEAPVMFELELPAQNFRPWRTSPWRLWSAITLQLDEARKGRTRPAKSLARLLIPKPRIPFAPWNPSDSKGSNFGQKKEEDVTTWSAAIRKLRLHKALEPILGPVVCELQSQGEEARKERERLLALEKQKLALNLEQLERLKRRRAGRFQRSWRAASTVPRRRKHGEGHHLRFSRKPST